MKQGVIIVGRIGADERQLTSRHPALAPQACVRRRAELSVAMNPHCGPKMAKAAVDKVFDQCFKDTAPFDR